MSTPQTVEWDEFYAYFSRRWRQGEHVSMIGPTGCGKTTLGLALLPIRKHVLVLGTKPTSRTDKTLMALHRKERYPIIRSWPPKYVRGNADRLILWPHYRRPQDKPAQRQILGYALSDVFTQGGWCVFADEIYYLSKQLGLGHLLEEYWTQGRAIGISLVGGTQRPAHVPLFMYDQATHLFFWADADEANLKRISGIGGLRSQTIRDTVAQLPRHAALYINSADRVTAIVTAPRR